MQTRRDQVHAYLHQQARLSAALVSGRPDPVESPARRTRVALVVSVVMGVLAVAVAMGVGAFLGPQRKDLTRADGVLLDSGTGARFLVAGGVAHPIPNLTSARLLLGRQPALAAVAHAELGRLRPGGPLGVPGAPDVPPAAAVLNRGVWTACAAPSTSGSPSGSAAGATGASVALRFGSPAPARVAWPDDRAVPVTADGKDALLWHGMRLALEDRSVLGVLGLGGSRVVTVPASWLALVPAGPALADPAIPDRGRPGPFVGGRRLRIGDLLQVDTVGAGTTFYRATGDGLVALTATRALLAQADGDAARLGQNVPRPLASSDLAQARILAPEGADPLPADPPKPLDVPAGTAPCVVVRGIGQGSVGQGSVGQGSVIQGAAGTGGATSALALGAVPDGGPALTVDPGAAALVVAPGGGGVPLLVTDAALAHPLPRPEQLGYSAQATVVLPPEMVALLPRGPELSAGAAGAAGAGAGAGPAVVGGVAGPG